MEYVYIVGCKEAKAYKIGYSDRPRNRMMELQIGCPYRLQQEEAIILMCPSGTGRLFEKILHERFKHRRTTGEWFKLTKEEYQVLLTPVVAQISLEHAKESGEFRAPIFPENQIEYSTNS